MPLHILKLAVGAASLEDIRAFAANPPGGRAVRTKVAPRRAAEVLAGGSLYWVVRGAVTARQPITAIEPAREGERAAFVVGPQVVAVRPRPCRPFQGWRYLRAADAPADFGAAAFDAAMPDAMRRDLLELCLL